MSDDSRSTERAERILDAAMSLFIHYGYSKTTVGDIAKAAGVSKGAIYLHWPGKEQLFEALIFREGVRVLDDTLARIEADAEVGTVFSLYQHAIMASIINPLMFAILTRDQRVIGDFTRRWNQDGFAVQAQGMRLEFVERLQAVGAMRTDFSAEVLTHVLTSIRVGLLMVNSFMPEDQPLPLEPMGAALAAVLDRGLSPEGGGNREAGQAALIEIMNAMRVMLQQMRQRRAGELRTE